MYSPPAEVGIYGNKIHCFCFVPLRCGSRSILVGMGQSSDGQHQGLVFRFLGFRGWSAALLGSCFCISISSLERGLVCASAAWSLDNMVAGRRSVGGWVGSVDFSLVLEERPIIRSPGPLPEHVVLEPSPTSERFGVAKLPRLFVGPSRSVGNGPTPWNDPRGTLRTKGGEREADYTSRNRERLSG